VAGRTGGVRREAWAMQVNEEDRRPEDDGFSPTEFLSSAGGSPCPDDAAPVPDADLMGVLGGDARRGPMLDLGIMQSTCRPRPR